MSYLIFRGVGTATGNGVIPSGLYNQQLTDVYVSRMPNHRKSSMRYSEYYVRGRDGALHVDEGYGNYDLTVKLVLINASVEKRYAVNAWADGSGKLISSDDVYTQNGSLVAKAYQASVKEEVVWERVKANQGFYDTATIIFNCQPFMVEAIDSQITLSASGSLVNPGSADAYPLIQVNGSGNVDFVFNGNEIGIDGMTAGTPVYIDCATGYVYTANGATSMHGNIPKLSLGTNTVTFVSNVTSLVVTPHWRWV